MPRQSEETEKASGLPDPELNPLLNPLLGEHMGRWAEVYFTAPPEQREEAVSALLRELKSEIATEPVDSIPKADPGESNFPPNYAVRSLKPVLELSTRAAAIAAEPAEQSSAVENIAIRSESPICGVCGHSIPDTQRFCGMCGALMPGVGVSAEPPSAERRSDTRKTAAPIESKPISGSQFDPSGVNSLRINQRAIGRDYLASQPCSSDTKHRLPKDNPLNNKVLSFGGKVPNESSRPATRRYRIYVGSALAVLSIALFFFLYQVTRDTSRTPDPARHEASTAASQTSEQMAPKPEAPAVPKQAVDARARPEANRQVSSKAEIPKKRTESPAPQAGKTTAVAPNPSPAVVGNGSEELLVAEHFLNGTQGKVRDSSEAARWLWQAVSKQNATATLLLSDLYMRGDGVAKNCDQARLLLDAAVRKGAVGASQRLRNLQSFGCQ